MNPHQIIPLVQPSAEAIYSCIADAVAEMYVNSDLHLTPRTRASMVHDYFFGFCHDRFDVVETNQLRKIVLPGVVLRFRKMTDWKCCVNKTYQTSAFRQQKLFGSVASLVVVYEAMADKVTFAGIALEDPSKAGRFLWVVEFIATPMEQNGVLGQPKFSVELKVAEMQEAV